MQSRVIIRGNNNSENGVSCGCFKCCTCCHFNFLQTPHGIFKMVELILGCMCQSLLINFGINQASSIGSSFISLLTTNASCVSTVTLLLICYIFSEKSYGHIRSSLFETLFNVSAALSYLSSSIYLCIAVNLYLYPTYLVTLGFVPYPAMIAAYMLGFALALAHAADAYFGYRYFRGLR